MTADTYVVEVTGSDDEHAVLDPAGRITLGPGDTLDLVLQVHIPQQANKGQTYEALVTARSEADPSLLAIGSTLTTASPDAGQDAESEELIGSMNGKDEKDTPAPAALAALGALAAAAAAGRRRRR